MEIGIIRSYWSFFYIEKKSFNTVYLRHQKKYTRNPLQKLWKLAPTEWKRYFLHFQWKHLSIRLKNMFFCSISRAHYLIIPFCQLKCRRGSWLCSFAFTMLFITSSEINVFTYFYACYFCVFVFQLIRPWGPFSIPVLAGVWWHSSWASVTVTTTISCWPSRATCFILTLEKF